MDNSKWYEWNDPRGDPMADIERMYQEVINNTGLKPYFTVSSDVKHFDTKEEVLEFARDNNLLVKTFYGYLIACTENLEVRAWAGVFTFTDDIKEIEGHSPL